MKERDNYLKLVEWSEEDQCYVGSIPGWIGACCHGDNEEVVFHELCQILDEWIEIYKNDSKVLPPATSKKQERGRKGSNRKGVKSAFDSRRLREIVPEPHYLFLRPLNKIMALDKNLAAGLTKAQAAWGMKK